MWNWLSKLWYEKLFDIGLFGLIIIAIVVVVTTAIKALKKVGDPTVEVDDKGKVKLTLRNTPTTGASVNSIDALELLLKTKDDEIYELRTNLENLTNKFIVLEAQVNKDKILAEFHKDNKVPLTEHSVFFNLLKNINGGVSLEVDDSIDEHIKLKIEIAKIYLEQCKMPVFYERMKEWVEGFDDIDTNTEALHRLYKIQGLIYEWVEEYSKKAETLFVVLDDGRSFKGLPLSFVEAFNEWHDPHVAIVMHKIKDVLFNAFYATWQLKLIVILDHIDTAFYLTVKDAEKTIVSINGKVDKEIKEKVSGKKG